MKKQEILDIIDKEIDSSVKVIVETKDKYMGMYIVGLMWVKKEINKMGDV